MNEPNSSLKAFVESLRGKNYEDAILLTERESINAYRRALRPCRSDQLQSTNWCDYSRKLADMIAFLRCESNPLRGDPEIRRLVLSVKEGFSKRTV